MRDRRLLDALDKLYFEYGMRCEGAVAEKRVIDPVGNAERFEVFEHFHEMLPARFAEVAHRLWSAFAECLMLYLA